MNEVTRILSAVECSPQGAFHVVGQGGQAGPRTAVLVEAVTP
jgi:hypothetical protein